MSLGLDVVFHDAALVGRQTVPDQDRLLAAQFTPQTFDEGNQAIGIIAAGAGLKEQAAGASIPSISECGRNRELLPIEGVNQDGRFSFRSPGSANGRTFGDPTLVLEEDPCFPAASVFFTAGHF